MALIIDILTTTVQTTVPLIRSYTASNDEQTLRVIRILDRLKLVVVRTEERLLKVLFVKRCLYPKQ